MVVNNNLRPSNSNSSERTIVEEEAPGIHPRFLSSRKAAMFHEKLRQLELFGEQHGHIGIGKEDDPTLYHWIRNLRRDAGEFFEERRECFPVSEAQRKLLDEMGFDWNPSQPSKTTLYYRAFISESKAFRVKNGHGDVFREGASDPNLDSLQNTLTYLLSKKDSLGKGRRAQLESFGIVLENYPQSVSVSASHGDSSDDGIEDLHSLIVASRTSRK